VAPPSNRRTGFSRRAQYTTFFAYIAAGLGAVLGGALLFASLSEPTRFAPARSAATDATAPVAKAAAAGRNESRGLWNALAGYFVSGREHARLRREVAEARVKLVEAQATAEENRRLKALLQLAGQDPAPVATAVLIGSSSSSTRRFATLSVGRDKDITVGMPVRSTLGLVGRVLEVGAKTSRVLLITDSESVVPVRRAQDALPAFATGRADGQLQVRLINLGLNPLKVGDVLVTSGSGGLYHPGIPVAVVSVLTRDGAIARVLSDPAASDFVMVEQVWNQLADPSATALSPAATAQPASAQ
jgi:rod shape-determining protein MreC